MQVRSKTEGRHKPSKVMHKKLPEKYKIPLIKRNL